MSVKKEGKGGWGVGGKGIVSVKKEGRGGRV